MQPPKSCCILAEQGLEVCEAHAINGFQEVNIARQESLGVQCTQMHMCNAGIRNSCVIRWL